MLVREKKKKQEDVIIKYGKFLVSVLSGKNVTYASLIWKGMHTGLLGQISLSDELQWLSGTAKKLNTPCSIFWMN